MVEREINARDDRYDKDVDTSIERWGGLNFFEFLVGGFFLIDLEREEEGIRLAR